MKEKTKRRILEWLALLAAAYVTYGLAAQAVKADELYPERTKAVQLFQDVRQTHREIGIPVVFKDYATNGVDSCIMLDTASVPDDKLSSFTSAMAKMVRDKGYTAKVYPAALTVCTREIGHGKQ